MKYGILGDVHANLSALEAVLARLAEERVDRLLCVGDVVGYGAAPRECIARLRDLGAAVVKGNHDAACAGEIDLLTFNRHARAAVYWTVDQLADEDVAWLAGLPLVHHEEHCSLAHGTLADPHVFDYIQTTTDAEPSLDAMELPVCFVGHSHVPVTVLRLHDDPLRTAYTTDTEIWLSEASRALVNVGSVGQPRDEDCRAAYAVLDTEVERVWIRRVPYDIEREASRIRAAGLPGTLADRLFLGV